MHLTLRGHVGLVVAGVALLPACDDADAGDSGSGRCGPATAIVERVVDGDTVELEGGERVRYLMIDTPESTQGATDCYGTESADFNRSLVEGKEVELTYDVDCDDQYDRLLAFVSVDGREVNSLLVERGLACVLVIPPNGQERQSEFEAAEQRAENDLVGMWGACEEVTCQ